MLRRNSHVSLYQYLDISLEKKSDSQVIEELDLAQRKKTEISVEKKIELLIRSLRENYATYGSQKITSGCMNFFIVPKVPLPSIKDNSPYKIWQKFVNQTVLLFDGKDRTGFIRELCELENAFSHVDSSVSPSNLLEKILSDFELKSGFLSVRSISGNDGDNGALTPTQFRTILALGHPINDFGTSLHHGVMSHRLQFYILGKYFLKNVEKFFTSKNLEELTNALAVQYPDMLEHEKFPVSKIVSIFYRLLGSEEFNNSFDWDAFIVNRNELNQKFNKRNIPNKYNIKDIWVQLFDRYGYEGFFSVPSSVGILQKLGCFRLLPAISEPNIAAKKDLRIIMDVTPKFTS